MRRISTLEPQTYVGHIFAPCLTTAPRFSPLPRSVRGWRQESLLDPLDAHFNAGEAGHRLREGGVRNRHGSGGRGGLGVADNLILFGLKSYQPILQGT